MRKTMLDGANLNGNMTEAAACKPRRDNAHKPLKVCPKLLLIKMVDY